MICARQPPPNQVGDDSDTADNTKPNTSERSELILFASNDPTTSCGPDAVTLRAPVLRLQTYSDASVDNIGDVNGCKDSLYIDPNGYVAIGKGGNSYYPDNVPNPFEVWSGTSQLLSVTANGDLIANMVTSTGKLTASGGIDITNGDVSGFFNLTGGTGLFGSIYSKDDGMSYTAATDGFVFACIYNTDGTSQGSLVGKANEQIRGAASMHRDTGGNNTVAVDYASFMMPVKKDENWQVNYEHDNDAKGAEDSPTISVFWMPLGIKDGDGLES